MTKLGYLHYYLFLKNCIHTCDVAGLFCLCCCLLKSVTNRECSGTISLYSIWPARLPLATPLALPLVFVFFSNQPALLSLISPLFNRVCTTLQRPDLCSLDAVVAFDPIRMIKLVCTKHVCILFE